MSENIKGTHGAEIAAIPSQDHRAFQNRGATVVSQEGRGGVAKPALRFRAFDVLPPEEGGGMSVTEARTAAKPAPRLKEQPLADLQGREPLPGLGPVPAPLTGDAPDDSARIIVPEEFRKPEPAQNVGSTGASSTSSGALGGVGIVGIPNQLHPAPKTPSKFVTFLGEFSDYVFPCFDVIYDEPNKCLTLVSAPGQQLKEPSPSTACQIKIGNVTKSFLFSGLRALIESHGLVVRVFFEHDESAAGQ